jgi:hypothetical protein
VSGFDLCIKRAPVPSDMMKLRKKLSGVFTSKKPDPPSVRDWGRPAWPERRPLSPLIPITESDTDEPVLSSQILTASDAIIDAMSQQQATLEQDVASKNAEIARLREQVLRDEGQRRQREATLALSAQRVLQLQEDMTLMQLETEDLRRRHESDIVQHRATIWEYEDRIWRQNQEAEDKFAREHDIEAPTHVGRVEAEIMAAVQSQMDAVAEMATNNERLGAQVALLESELLNAHQALENQQALHARAMRTQNASMADIEWTPRAVLAIAIATSGHDAAVPNNDRPEVALFMHDLTMDTLTNQSLDVRLTPGQACQLAGSIDSDDLTLLTCDLCHRPKIARKEGAPASARRMNEFSSKARPTSCCSKHICKTCYLEGVKASLANNWWDKLDQTNWIVCPAPDCEANLLGRGSSVRTLERLLLELGEGNVYAQVGAYNRALELRTALRDLSLDEKALDLAWQLHFTLISSRKMHSPLDLTIDVGEIKTVRIDQSGQSIHVPLLANFLRRRTTERAKECAFCAEELLDIDIDGSEDWLDVCSGFYGDWVWQLLLFPIKMSVGCRHEIGFCSRNSLDSCNGGVEYCQHEIDFCTGCLQRHLETQLEQHGRSVTNQLACPSADCGRVLGHNEIKLYAKEETFQT